MAVAAVSILLEDLTSGEFSSACGYKMGVLGEVNVEHVNQFIKKNEAGDSVLFTDKNIAYAPIEDRVEICFKEVSGENSTNHTPR